MEQSSAYVQSFYRSFKSISGSDRISDQDENTISMPVTSVHPPITESLIYGHMHDETIMVSDHALMTPTYHATNVPCNQFQCAVYNCTPLKAFYS